MPAMGLNKVQPLLIPSLEGGLFLVIIGFVTAEEGKCLMRCSARLACHSQELW